MDRLPIDAHLDEIVAAVRSGRDVVLEAPPGSGKTTRVPPALAGAGLRGGGRVVVLEPRRIATRLAATRIAAERGQSLGGPVGYRVRHEARESDATRLLFVTEGILNRRILDDPDLAGVSVVVFDEFHERSVHADLALGLVREIQSTIRPELRVVIMSATLDSAEVASALDAEVVRTEGSPHPVEVVYEPPREPRSIADEAAQAVLRTLDGSGRDGGSLLVFLPGVGEILRAQERLRDVAARLSIDIVPLYGELDADAQDRAVRAGERRRVVLATNVAETSITLDGIHVVIDTGFARVMRHDPASGVDRLGLERITKASAEQRKGRAGRQGPGRCVRLYRRGEFDAMQPSLEPELLRVDLAEPVLLLKEWGTQDLLEFPWLTRPQPDRLDASERLLRALGAVGEGGGLTAIGRRLARIPVHPRLGRMMVAAEEYGCAATGAELAALAVSRSLVAGDARTVGRSDLLLGLDLLHDHGRRAGGRSASFGGIDRRVLAALEREARQLKRIFGERDIRDPDEDVLLRCVLAGYPDRVARRRESGGSSAVLVGGSGVAISDKSVVKQARLFVALDAVDVGRGRDRRAAVLSGIEEEWLEELFPGSVRTIDVTIWNDERRAAEGRRRRVYLDLVLDEKRLAVPPDPVEASRLLARAATHPRALAALRTGRLERLLLRLECMGRAFPELALPDVDDRVLAAAVESACTGRSRFEELEGVVLDDHVLVALGGGDARSRLRAIPDRIRLPSGRDAPVTYRRGQDPIVSAKLQEFFSARASPRIADGRVVVAVDLLAPNGRSVQITSDLAGFWKNLYPKERRELMRRYPRHPWPEDPENAPPTSRPLPRRRRDG